MTPLPRWAKLSLIAGGLAAAVGALYGLGVAIDSNLVRFGALMLAAGTFLPFPADTFVLAAAADHPAAQVGIVGGAANTAAVLVERWWLLALVDHPAFDRIRRFFDQNRWVALTERNMFVALVVGGATFIPFEPFRLVAALRRYPVGRYAAATLLSRGCRYYVLAVAGSALFEVGLLQQAIWITLALFAFGLWRSAVRIRRQRRERTDGDDPLPTSSE